jgi:hypothetical protein
MGREEIRSVERKCYRISVWKTATWILGLSVGTGNARFSQILCEIFIAACSQFVCCGSIFFRIELFLLQVAMPH